MDVTATPGASAPDDRDLDEGGLDLSPRPDGASRPRRSLAARRWGAIVVLGLLVLVIGAIVWQAKGATLYYKNADEAVAQRTSLGSKNFRLQGTVLGDSVEPTESGVKFTVAFDGGAGRRPPRG